MSKFLLIFGIVVFLCCSYILVVSFFATHTDPNLFYFSILGMLNASIAIAVSEILDNVKTSKS
ncbi:hypothetical protein FAY30_23330 [Bacillus sp. S3]|nr:hypothetical protein FAY30_23330 [Bacillus sp. S3]